MKLQKILRSQLGFSLVEITVAMGLLGLATLAVMQLSENVTTSTRRAETMLSKSQFASALGGYLNSSKACGEMVQMTGLSSTPKPMVLTEWKVAGVDDEILKEIKANKKFKNFTIKSLTAALASPTGGTTFPTVSMIPPGSSTPVTYTKTFLNVVAVLEVNTKAGNPANSPKREYEYFFNIPVLENGGQVKFCGEQKNMYETCAVMNGKYNDDTKKCELQNSCSLKGSYSLCIQGSCPNYPNQPNPLTNGYGCVGSDTTKIQTGIKEWQHQTAAATKKSPAQYMDNTYVYYSCLSCPGMGSGTTTPTTPTTPTYPGPGPGSSGGCFVAGTQIQYFGGDKKNIEEVKVGDSLVDHSGKEVKVIALKSYDYQGKIYSINGGAYFFTPNHPFLTTSGWKSLSPAASMKESPGIVVSKLKVGDILLKKNGFEVIKTLDARDTEEKVYNFTVTDSHEYIADDFAVHNVVKAPSDHEMNPEVHFE